MSKVTSISVKFESTKNNKRVRFAAHLGENNNSFIQQGSFRSDWDWKQFTDINSFKKEIEKYAKTEKAYASRVMIDHEVLVFGYNDPTAYPVVLSVLDLLSK